MKKVLKYLLIYLLTEPVIIYLAYIVFLTIALQQLNKGVESKWKELYLKKNVLYVIKL